jgi:archaellum component FlaG (FlaF/FlaG flagellin family)
MSDERSTVSAKRLFGRGHARHGERGQILVMFVLAIFVVVGVVGLVLDGGSTFAQRRDEQNVADLSAMAGAYAYLNAPGAVPARAAFATNAARTIATANGYTQGVNGTTIDVTVNGNNYGADIQVDLTGAHRNNFAAVLGMETWNVSVTATANTTTRPNGAIGAMPLLFNAAAFPGAVCDESAGTCVPEVYQLPGTGNEDVPQDATQFNWTVFCTAHAGGGNGNTDQSGQAGCNANSRDVADIMDNNGTSTTVYLNNDIGPFDSGTHTTLFDNLEAHVGETFPVPIVESDGTMWGWAYFHLVSIEGAPDKVIRGYFVSPVNADKLVVNQNGGTSMLDTGVMPIKLTN